VMAGVLPAATRWSEGSRKSSLSIFIFQVARHRPLRSCGDFSPCSIVRPLPLEDLGTTSALPGRLCRGVRSSRNRPRDDAGRDAFHTGPGQRFGCVQSRPGVLGSLIAAIDLRGNRRRGGSDNAPIRYVDERANPPCIARGVVFRAGPRGRYARHLFLDCVLRMCIGCPAAASNYPDGYELASRRPCGWAHAVVRTVEPRGSRLRRKRPCGGRRVSTLTAEARQRICRFGDALGITPVRDNTARRPDRGATCPSAIGRSARTRRSGCRGADTCACRKLNPAILVMQSAQDWATKNVPGAIDGARDRCIFLQG
jgi:hypothetical protein